MVVGARLCGTTTMDRNGAPGKYWPDCVVEDLIDRHGLLEIIEALE